MHSPAKHRRTARTRRTVIVGAASGVAAAALLLPGVAHAAPTPNTTDAGTIIAPDRTQITVAHTATGARFGTANQHESRPALSMVKLFIADYVFKHGTPAEQAQATQMLRTSDDQVATSLYAAYPQSITDTANAYGLTDTHANERWGYSTTSTADVAEFLEAKKQENPADPILLALATASPVAADGYHQDYGTANLPGVIGTKWGWSDDRQSLHASASFGTDFTVAAQTNGPAAQLTADVHDAFTTPAAPIVPGLPELPEGMPGSASLELPALPELPVAPELPPLPEMPAAPQLPASSAELDSLLSELLP